IPSKSNLQIRSNNAVPEPSMCSAYRNRNGGEVCASSRRSSCLRSINRSVRKSYPSQVNKSNVKKHGSFPTAEQQIFELWSASFIDELWSASFIEGANFAVNDR